MNIETLKNVYVMEDRYLDQLVKDNYGHDLDFCAVMECGNDTVHLFRGINGKMEDKWDIQEFAEFITEGKSRYSTPDQVLQDLCKKGIIEPGNYVIKVSW